jgi:hypothetical protein
MGLRGQNIIGTEDGKCQVRSIAIATFDYYGFHLPYSYSLDHYRGHIVNTDSGTWEIKDQILVVAYGDGIVKKFPAGTRGLMLDGFFLEPRRRWWGYPAQALQVMAVPIDIVSGPFILCYHALFGSRQIGP